MRAQALRGRGRRSRGEEWPSRVWRTESGQRGRWLVRAGFDLLPEAKTNRCFWGGEGNECRLWTEAQKWLNDRAKPQPRKRSAWEWLLQSLSLCQPNTQPSP